MMKARGVQMALARSNTGFTRWRCIGLGFVILWFLIGGVAHFVATDLEMRIVPDYIARPRLAVFASGVFELLGAAGLFIRSCRRAAGIGLFALTMAVTPANVYMLQHAERFGVPHWILVLRLPVQVALLALIAWTAILPGRPAPGTRT
jgi:uncharacterized membrane protein